MQQQSRTSQEETKSESATQVPQLFNRIAVFLHLTLSPTGSVAHQELLRQAGITSEEMLLFKNAKEEFTKVRERSFGESIIRMARVLQGIATQGGSDSMTPLKRILDEKVFDNLSLLDHVWNTPPRPLPGNT